MLTLRFRDFPEDIARSWLIEIIEVATGNSVSVIADSSIDLKVDLEITGPYGGSSDEYKTPFLKKLIRFGYIKISKGHHLSKRYLSAGIQPSLSANKNIWFTGENKRPPQGTWDGYLSFETKISSDRSVYLPLWMLTCTDLLKTNISTYWMQQVPTVESLLKPRKMTSRKKKFCCSFIGKTYPMRLHALEYLSQIQEVDVFGTSVRNPKQFPGEIATKYDFCLCFENDIYPGYVTEKPFEAYIAGTIPLYYGYDVENYLNPKATINLLNFKNLDDWTTYIEKVNENDDLYREIFEQPILIREPNLNDAVTLIKKILSNA
jgi:hypothetical protein